MKNSYTADVGDYGKYGFLRFIIGAMGSFETSLRLGMHWYLTPDDGGKDGRHLEYLDRLEKYRECDPDLFDYLKKIRDGEIERSVLSIEKSGLLPRETRYFRDELTYQGLPGRDKATMARRMERREKWIIDSLGALDGVDFVFLDPDTGIEIASCRSYTAKGPKYVYRSEVRRFIERGITTVVYQHQNRAKGGFTEHLLCLMEELHKEYEGCDSPPYSLLFNSHGIRAFIILPCGKSGQSIVRRASAIANHSEWGRYFSGINVNVELR